MTPFVQNIEGLSLVVCALLIFLTLRRKGKNRLLLVLGWFFLAGGVFRLGMFLPGLIGSASGSHTLALVASVVSNSCLYFGLAGYASMQVRFLYGTRGARLVWGAGMTLAFLLTIFQATASGLLFVSETPLVTWLARYQLVVMLSVFGVGFVFLLIMFFVFFLRARQEHTSFVSNSTMNIGLGLMLVSWMVQKLVIVDMGSIAGAILSTFPFLSLGVVIVAVFLQTSSAMLPGSIFDAVTKQPIGLAIVRVVRLRDNKVLETRVTSADGRYGILVEPGTYLVTAQGAGFTFPSSLPLGYRGEPIEIKKSTVLGFDIFLDRAVAASV